METSESTSKRAVWYIVGLNLIAATVVLNIRYNVGVAAFSSVMYAISEIYRISLGTASIICYLIFVVMQCILSRRITLIYLLEIPLSFAFGVLTAEAVKRRYKSRQNRDINIHWRQIVVMVEIALVVVAAMLPQKLNPTVNIIISFVCAMQVETFRKVRGSAFATTMCTGNLRSGTEQFIIWQQTGDKTAKKKMRNYYSIILIFILGGAIGTLSTHALGEKALLLTLVPLLTVFFIMFIEEEREEIEDNGGQA